MSWFHRLCRQSGLLVHHLVKPVTPPGQKQQVSHRVEQRQQGNVTLRRTTIEEIEIRPAGSNPSEPCNDK
jgi:hypothetical protein